MQEERKRILELVKDGKLSPEEALILFEALETRGERKEQKESEILKEMDPNPERSKDQADYKHSEEKQSSQFSGARDKILDFVNSAISKIKDFDISQSVEFPHVYQQANIDITKIDVDIANGHVEVKTWDQPDIRVECQAKVYRKENRDEARTFFIDNSSFFLENGLLRFSTQSKWMKVDTTVYVPKTSYEKASIRTFNGSVTSEGLSVVDLRTKTANGKVFLKRLDTDKLDAETANGKITIQESKANRLSAETMHGNIDVDGVYHTIDLQTLNGNLSCILNDHLTDTIHLKAVTGNINVHIPEEMGVQGECKSYLGSVKLEMDGIEILEEKKEVVQKQTRFKRSGKTEKPLHVFAETKTGTILVKNSKSEVKNEA